MSSEELIISVSGVRGIVGDNLTSAIAAEYGAAFGSFIKAYYGKAKKDGNEKLSICIGTDSRPSGQMLKAAITAGICATGLNVVDIGLVTTPTVGVMLRQLNCQGGIVITASHNPIAYNGIKLLLDNGIAPPPKKAAQIKQLYLDKKFDYVESIDCGKITKNNEANAIHIDKVVKLVDCELIKSKKFKVVLDSVNGAGGPAGKILLEKLGCEVVPINYEPNGIFAHTPEPTAENLVGLCGDVKKAGAMIGFAQDPDADRLAIVDENGNYIGEEFTLALVAEYVLSKTPGNAAANLSTSRMIDDVAKKYGGKVIRTAVGEANVASAMIEHNCVIGGEGNGGVIDLRVGPVRDSLLAMAIILQLAAETNKTIGSLASDIGGYYMSKAKFKATKSQADEIIAKAKDVFADAKVDLTDGCRFDFDDGWLHLRTSNTEPVMRMIIEADDKAAAKAYAEIVLKIQAKILN